MSEPNEREREAVEDLLIKMDLPTHGPLATAILSLIGEVRAGERERCAAVMCRRCRNQVAYAPATMIEGSERLWHHFVDSNEIAGQCDAAAILKEEA